MAFRTLTTITELTHESHSLGTALIEVRTCVPRTLRILHKEEVVVDVEVRNLNEVDQTSNLKPIQTTTKPRTEDDKNSIPS